VGREEKGKGRGEKGEEENGILGTHTGLRWYYSSSQYQVPVM